jgi:hypothetical protein
MGLLTAAKWEIVFTFAILILLSTCLGETTCDRSIIEMEAFDKESIPQDMNVKKPPTLLQVIISSIM